MANDLILILEDARHSRPSAAAALAPLNGRKYRVRNADALSEGMELLARERFAAAIIDLGMPETPGLPTFIRFQAKAGTTPIVVVVDRKQEDLGSEAVRRGALDYLIRDELSGALLDKVLRLALERTHTVLALRSSEARYRTMFESTAAGVYQATTDDRLISANPAFISLLGYPSEEAVLALDFGTQIAMNHEDHLSWRRELEVDGEIRSREMTLRNQRGERVIVLHSARLVRDSRGVPLYYEGTVADITASHRQARQWSYEASHDALTNLLNRRELERRLQSAFENATIDRSTLAIVMVDLDGFKQVNDRFGHAAGDDLLRHVALLLRGAARAGDLIARFGGDEFVIVLEHCCEEDANRVAQTILERLKTEECLWAGQPIAARASIGVTTGSGREPAWVALLERADLACYDAKAHGGNQVRLFRDDCTVNLRMGRNRQFALAIEEALTEGTLRLLGQNIVPLHDPNRPGHYELLLCAPDNKGEPVLLDPAQLSAELPALAHKLDDWSIRTGFRWIARNAHGHPTIDRWFINLSRVSLEDPALPRSILAAAQETGVPPNRVGLEIEEQALATCFVQASELIRRLAPRGYQFTLDGFGRGVSSFAYLKALPVSYVKIDFMAMTHGAADGAALAMLRSLHQLNHALGHGTIISGLASPQTLPELTTMGIDFVQGTAISAPITLRDRGGTAAQSQSA